MQHAPRHTGGGACEGFTCVNTAPILGHPPPMSNVGARWSEEACIHRQNKSGGDTYINGAKDRTVMHWGHGYLSLIKRVVMTETGSGRKKYGKPSHRRAFCAEADEEDHFILFIRRRTDI